MATEDIYGEFDRLSNLPDSLLCSHILSRLPLTDTVRSSLLARKWRYLWTKIAHLNFTSEFFRHMSFHAGRRPLFGYSSGCIEDIMEHILIQHSAPLDSFRFHLPMSISIESVDIQQCIHHAAKKGVKRMVLQVESTYLVKKMHLPPPLFFCTTLVDLELVSFMIPEVLTLFETFSFLKTFCLSEIGNLTDHRLQRLVELCPLLQELMLIKCYELTHLKIQAPNLHYLILVGCTSVESLTADCPQLLQLEIRDRSNLAKLEINTNKLVDLKLWNCCKLSKLQLNSRVFLKEAGSLEGHSNVELLKKLSLKKCSSELSGLPCSTLFGNFPDLQELQGSPCMMGIDVVRGQDFTFPNLKNAYLDISSDMSEKEVTVLDSFLRNAPSLKSLTLALPYCPEGIDDQDFQNKILGLKPASAEVEIIWEDDNEDSYVDERRWDNEHDNDIHTNNSMNNCCHIL